VAIARNRVRSVSVSFEVADVFSWNPGTRFDVIFSAWLSHVPASWFGKFWQLLGSLPGLVHAARPKPHLVSIC
jgi:trans-aconitate methyltransferase